MPRSLGAIVAPTYTDFYGKFIVSIYSGWTALGYRKGEHYVVGKRGPKKWPLPHSEVEDWSYSIHWCNGSAQILISQDGKSAGNALSTDYHLLDEAKKLDELSYLNDTAPTKRGNKQYFGGMSEHGSMLVASDRPTTSAEKWILRWKDQMDPVLIKKILELHFEEMRLTNTLKSGRLSSATVAQYESKIRTIKRVLNIARRNAVYYHEANVLDNIDMVGLDGVKDLADSITNPMVFRTAVMNEELDFVEGGFYADLDVNKHTYQPKTNAHTLGLGIGSDIPVRDCRQDNELHPHLPLDIALDYGLFSGIGFAQLIGNVFRIDNALKAYHPELVQDLLQRAIQYYAPHPFKTVIYHFDHTAINRDGKSNYTYFDLVVAAWKRAGWTVVLNPMGHTAPPQQRYEMWGAQFRESNPRIRVMFNRVNCADVLTSMRLTRAKQGPTGFTKDKNPERDVRLDQAHAPHLGDMADTLLGGRLRMLDRGSGAPLPSMFA